MVRKHHCIVIIITNTLKVKVAKALCKDFPVRYVVAKASELKDILTGEEDEDFSGELELDEDVDASHE